MAHEGAPCCTKGMITEVAPELVIQFVFYTTVNCYMRSTDQNKRALLILIVLGLSCGLLILLCAAYGLAGIWLRWSGILRPATKLGTPPTLPSLITPVLLETLSPTQTASPMSPTPSELSWPHQTEGTIVFTCFIDGFDEICLMDASNDQVQRLTYEQATDFYPSLSPGGDIIVFSSRRDGRFEIYSMDLTGGNQVRLTEGLGSLFAPAVSPDGHKIVFTNALGGHQAIWIMNRDGSDPQPLTYGTRDDIDPTWSPDGGQIAFASTRGDSRQLYMMEADGDEIRQVTQGILHMGGRNDWSPDGSALAFYAGPRGDRNIYLVDIEGGYLQQLTEGGDNLAPSFSPDGQWIAFTSFRDGNNEIYIMRVDGSEIIRLTHNMRSDWQPRWGPNK